MAETWFRSVDARYPFLWESAAQPAARWHGAGEGPVQYFSSTPDGAWAEFLRHEEIIDPDDLEGIRRALWAVELDLDRETLGRPELPERALVGGLATHARCRVESRRLRAAGATGVRAPSAALGRGAGRGQRCEAQQLVEAADRDGETLALFGSRPEARGWLAADRGSPGPRLLGLVRRLR